MLLRLLAGLVGLTVSLWCALALAYAPLGPSPWTLSLALLYLTVLAFMAWRRVNPIWRWATWGGVIGWFLLVPAPSEAAWAPESRVAPQVIVRGETVQVRGIRNFHWRGPNQFETGWVDRTYELSRLRGADFFLSFWGPQRICHTFVSFAFDRPEGGLEHVAVSIEVRKKEGQTYSPLGSLFRQFSLIYVWATETDVVQVRTNYRDEQVYRYAVRLEPQQLREIFLRYAQETQQLHDQPRWYNAVTSNCGVDILRTVWGNQIRSIPSLAQLSNGLWESQAYAEGRLDQSVPFEKLRARANITAAAQAARPGEFSEAIRQKTVWLNLRKQPK